MGENKFFTLVLQNGYLILENKNAKQVLIEIDKEINKLYDL